MSYRSLTRLLGETRLERKCRWLFAGSLLLLIVGAFLLVDRITTDLVMKNTRDKGRDMVDMLMLKVHFDFWQTDLASKSFAKAIIDDFERNQNYRYEILTLSEEPAFVSLNARRAAGAEEEEILRYLQREFANQQSAIEDAELVDEPETGGDSAVNEADKRDELLASLRKTAPIFKDRPLPREREYHYYEPIYWKSTCKFCHLPPATGALEAAESSGSFGDTSSLYAVKVIIPYGPTQNAINRARAVLIAMAFLTVFLAMIALYAVVRYVIVRPLKHLRDVSDEISHGSTELRAEIHTRDEFEDLADSFNRMVRHLTDAQAKLRDVNRNLDGKVDELAQLNMRLHEMNRLKSDFLTNMSHELRTPLNSIIGFSEVLQGIDSLDDKQNRYAANIQTSGRLLLDMINDILDLAKMEAGKMDLRPTEFHVDAVVGAQCDMIRSLIEEKNIDLEVDVPAQRSPLYQDQTKLQQILTNLLSNAIKFTPDGGRISVVGRRDDKDRFELTVSDTGVGIAEDDREIIFEKFRQSTEVLGPDGLTREFSGTGLGLSIVKELCKLMGGEVSVESELGKGSSFRVCLPWRLQDSSRRLADLNSTFDDATNSRSADLQSPWHARQGVAPAAVSGPRAKR